MTVIKAPDWLAHPGSVGNAALGTLHILGEDGEELPVGEVGGVYFEGGGTFEYHNDPEKTARAVNDKGWATLGALGSVDEEGTCTSPIGGPT
jgi:long-chain acyl-CoA synthetase